ncbi:cytochrome c-type biogenesis protein CcmH [Cricetibacter osteomyelitidis]|uniref:Cytochrome c-type biogenesis protein CcmH n=1 Tax=Cricetibacter osteomyelitidis TaxID=1521931 RepID=A0A4R2TKZ5_9PAST|nr:hypothetical protein [Cricetibacter osteomyelitidis]TCP95542.1 cytochrome c-type biogenesis protein CcmH [Cricetibacter osteomyelitidis]
MAIGILAFILITFGIMAIPFAHYFDWQKNYRRQTNIALYQQQIRYADQPLADEMAQRLLQDEQYSQNPNIKSAVHFSKKSAIFFALLLIIAALGYYFSLNRLTTAELGLQQSGEKLAKFEHSSSMQKNDDAILHIQNKLRQDPNNGENWFELGQLYMYNNEFEHALTAFGNAEGLLGSRSDILSAAAASLYYQNGQRLNTLALNLLNAALEKDPKNTAALSLLASDAFLQTDYRKALQIWQQILDSGYTDVDRRAIIQSMQMAEMLQSARNKQ